MMRLLRHALNMTLLDSQLGMQKDAVIRSFCLLQILRVTSQCRDSFLSYGKRNPPNPNPRHLPRHITTLSLTTPISFPETTIFTESKQDAEYSLSSNDEFSDSHDDYVCPELNTNDDSKVEEQENERKFIVFESMLDQLFVSCRTCGSLCKIEKSNRDSIVTVTATCFNNHTNQRNSRPELHNKPAGDILIPAATVITAGSYKSTKQFASTLHPNFVNKQQFYDAQKKLSSP